MDTNIINYSITNTTNAQEKSRAVNNQKNFNSWQILTIT